MLLSISRLLNKASHKLGAKARVDMTEEDMGGGRHDDDVRNMSDAAASYPLPQQYEGGERQSLDESQALFNKPASLKHYKTGTKLFTAELTDKGEVFARMKMEATRLTKKTLSSWGSSCSVSCAPTATTHTYCARRSER